MTKPRVDVIMYLSDAAMGVMADSKIEALTPAEVLSASFTTCKRVIEGILANSAPEDLDYNKQTMVSGIAELFQVVKPAVH